MDPVTAALLASARTPAHDLAFSALPDAPRRPEPPRRLRRALGRGLLRAAGRVEPSVRPAVAAATR